jgi:hypothetical protein
MGQDNNTKVFTAAMAVIKINGLTSGYMRSLTFTENIQRGEVKGISHLALQEVPPTGVMCSFSADFFFISLARPEVRAFLMRDQGLDAFINTLILGEIPVRLDIYRKVATNVVNGVVLGINPEGKTIASIRDAYTNSQNVSVNDSTISGTSVSGIYLNPVFTNA